MNFKEAENVLKDAGQEHVLKYYNELDDNGKMKLLNQIEKTDFSVIKNSIAAMKKEPARREVTPIRALQLNEINSRRDEFENTGINAIQNGEVGAVLLAGGMGTRLGADGPKGVYDIGITKPVYIFERLISNLLDVVRQAGVFIHLFIMTSDRNNDETIQFLSSHDFFGYDRNYIHFFRQEMAVATDTSGKVFMDSKDHIADSPNGNGGWFISLERSGLMNLVHNEGIRWLNVFAVDNVLQRIADPVFIGAVASSGNKCGSKVVKKSNPDEKVGVMCLKDGHPSVVEYYELTDKLRNTLDEKGEPAYNFGVILNYLFDVGKLEEISPSKLPWHVVEKKIPYLDEDGNLVKPETPNGYKYETLILDMIEMFDGCLPFEVERNREFAPIKNKTGVDSVESARALLKENGISL